MATRRNRNQRSQRNNNQRRNRSQRNRRGSGLFGEKTSDENVRNCERYWHRDDPSECYKRVPNEPSAKRTDLFDYPGLFHVNKPVTVKKGMFRGLYTSGKQVYPPNY